MKASPILFVFILSTLFWGCEKVEKLEDFPLESPKITFNCNLKEGEKIEMEISRSLSVIDGAPLQEINNAKVLLYEDNTLVATLNGSNLLTNKGHLYLADVLPKPGKTYRVEASAPKYGKISAEGTVPMPVYLDSVYQKIIDSAWRQYGADYGWFSIYNATSTIKFKDNPNEKNYYVLSHQVIADKKRVSGVSFPSSIAGTQVINNMVLFDDATFNGKTYALQYDWSGSAQLKDTATAQIEIRYTLLSVSKDYYLYLLSYNAFQENRENPFAEPVQVFNNIQGGYGIFGGSALSTKNFIIK